MKVVIWEPMNNEVYDVFESLEEAKEKYNVSEDYDFFEKRNDELWIALVD